jgi:hypothetical protein
MTVEIQVNDFLIVIARGNNSIFASDKQKHFFIVISWKNGTLVSKENKN